MGLADVVRESFERMDKGIDKKGRTMNHAAEVEFCWTGRNGEPDNQSIPFKDPLRSVRIQQGTHTVLLQFQPNGMGCTAIITMAGHPPVKCEVGS